MHTVVVMACRLLGLTTFVFHASASKVASGAVIWVWPPGTDIYPGESVVLQCGVPPAHPGPQQDGWSYAWFRHGLRRAPPALHPPRHLAYRDTYAITGAAAEDAGGYRCRAEGPGSEVNGSGVTLFSEEVRLTVSGTLPPLLSLTPSSLQFFRGDSLTVRCPGSVGNQTAWRLRQLSRDLGVRMWDLQAGSCSPLGGGVSVQHPNACLFAGLSSGNGGLYWCQSDTQRSNAVTVTVITNDTVILKGPYLVSEGDRVILHCQFRKGGGRRTATFFKDGVELATRSSGLAMENVSKAQEGFYKCTSPDRTLESPESWLSVQCNSTRTDWTEASTHGTWIISSVAGGLLLFSIGLIVWLIHHRWGKQRSALDRRWPSSKADVASADVPETKQDVTEVQWDLSWMEMSGLLDKP